MDGSQANSWKKELDDFVRAFSGAFLFGMPFLLTMELWWIGVYANRWKLLVFLALAFIVNTHLAYFAGFKRESTFRNSLFQAIDAMAVGVVASFIVLLVLNRIGIDDPLRGIVGKIVVQAIPLSIGASVANAFLHGPGNGRETESVRGSPWRAALNDFGATVAGGIFIGFSLAPTDEIPMLAADMDHQHELALLALSLLITYAIVFASGFSPQESGNQRAGFLQHPMAETVVAYLISLLVALTALYLFDRIEIGDPPFFVLTQVLVLGLPTAVGGAAGRLVI